MVSMAEVVIKIPSRERQTELLHRFVEDTHFDQDTPVDKNGFATLDPEPDDPDDLEGAAKVAAKYRRKK